MIFFFITESTFFPQFFFFWEWLLFCFKGGETIFSYLTDLRLFSVLLLCTIRYSSPFRWSVIKYYLIIEIYNILIIIDMVCSYFIPL